MMLSLIALSFDCKKNPFSRY